MMMMMNVINLMIISIIQNDLRIEFNASTLTFFLLFEEVVWIIRLVFFFMAWKPVFFERGLVFCTFYYYYHYRRRVYSNFVKKYIRKTTPATNCVVELIFLVWSIVLKIYISSKSCCNLWSEYIKDQKLSYSNCECTVFFSKNTSPILISIYKL